MPWAEPVRAKAGEAVTGTTVGRWHPNIGAHRASRDRKRKASLGGWGPFYEPAWERKRLERRVFQWTAILDKWNKRRAL